MNNLDSREVKKIVANELKIYKALKVAMENRRELLDKGVNEIFPSLVDRVREKELKYKQINRALTEALSENERSIIEKKYLGENAVNDITIYLDLGLTKEQYYIAKREGIFQLAIALGII